MHWMYKALETNLIPDSVIRWGIRRMLTQTIRTYSGPTTEAQQARLMGFIEELKQSPIAIETDAANTQHYEVPAKWYELALGPRKKYSSCYWTETTKTLAEAEETMLALTCERADIRDGQTILDLGCGWGSMSLWLAEKYPNANITGLSNSASQKQWIDATAKAKGFHNLTIVTANINDYEGESDWANRFDRVVSIEMFEHMKNYQRLMAKIASWLKPQGKLFVHIFTHKDLAYHYENTDGNDWLTEYFFTGGTMPSDDLLLYFQDDLTLEGHWHVNGTHYEKTANAWIENMYANRDQLKPILANIYGPNQVTRWWVYWKVFFLACAELWGYQNGEQWLVSHYRFVKP